MEPGPSRNGSPHCPPNAGISVVYATTVVSIPSTAFSRSAGISITSRSSASPSTALASAALVSLESPTSRIMMSARASSAITLGARPPESVPMFSVLGPSSGSTGSGMRRIAASASISLWMAESPSSGIRRMRHLPGRHHLVPQRAFGAERQLVLGRLAVDDVARSARLLRRVVRSRAVALFARPRRALRDSRSPASSSASTAVSMEAMMPLVSHAPRPQTWSSSSREAKNGGTVSMWVESVTVSSLPHWAKMLNRRGSTSMRSTRPSNRAASGFKY